MLCLARFALVAVIALIGSAGCKAESGSASATAAAGAGAGAGSAELEEARAEIAQLREELARTREEIEGLKGRIAEAEEAAAEGDADAEGDAKGDGDAGVAAAAVEADAGLPEALKGEVKVAVVIDSEPRGAAVFVEGARRGQTPMILDLVTSADEVPIRVEKPGYRPQLQTVRPQEDTKLSVQLSRL